MSLRHDAEWERSIDKTVDDSVGRIERLAAGPFSLLSSFRSTERRPGKTCEPIAMTCPNCELINLDTAERCDCGFEFVTDLDIPEPQEFRWLLDLPRPRQVTKKPDPVAVGVFLGLIGLILILSNLRGEDAVYGLVALCVVIFIIFIILRVLGSGDNLLSNGDISFAKLVHVQVKSFDSEGTLWRLVWVFRDSNARVRYISDEASELDCRSGQDWAVPKVGGILPVVYDSKNSSHNHLLVDLDKIGRPGADGSSSTDT